jgi:hypothetical protein
MVKNWASRQSDVGLYCFLKKKKGGLYVGPIMHFFSIKFHEINNIKI